MTKEWEAENEKKDKGKRLASWRVLRVKRGKKYKKNEEILTLRHGGHKGRYRRMRDELLRSEERRGENGKRLIRAK